MAAQCLRRSQAFFGSMPPFSNRRWQRGRLLSSLNGMGDGALDGCEVVPLGSSGLSFFYRRSQALHLLGME